MRVPKRAHALHAYALKIALRAEAISQAGLQRPLIVCETHGGHGTLYEVCYRDAKGLVCDHDDIAVTQLATQRPTWRVYQCNVGLALREGLGADLCFSVLDCDPYGAPWETLEGFFISPRVFAPIMAVIVTDGSRQKQRIGGLMYGWESQQERHGRNLWGVYLACCQERFDGIIAQAGYTRAWWHGRYGGHSGQMTYWAAVLTRPQNDGREQESEE